MGDAITIKFTYISTGGRTFDNIYIYIYNCYIYILCTHIFLHLNATINIKRQEGEILLPKPCHSGSAKIC